MTAISTLTVLPETKEEIKKYKEDVKTQILSGNTDPLIIHRQIKAFETILKDLQKDAEIKEYVLTEANKYEKTFDAHNCTFTVLERATLNYKEDSEWKSMQNDIDVIKKQQKAREILIKAATNKGDVVPDANGEIVSPVSKKSTTVLTCKIK